MDLTPLDIYNKEFKKSFKVFSYDMVEVDTFLDRVAKSFENLYNENRDLKEEVETLKEDIEKYKEMEDNLRESMFMAQKTAEEIKSNSEKEAELILKEAEQKAEEIISSAREEIKDKERKLEEIQKHEELFRIRFKTLLETHLKMLKSDDDISEIENKVEDIVDLRSDSEHENEEQVDIKDVKKSSSQDTAEL